MALGVRTVVHQNLRHIPVTGVHLPGEKHQIGEVRIEDAGLHHDTGACIGDFKDRFPEMPHAPRQPMQGYPERQQHADHTEQERRGKHLIDVDAPRTQGDQLAVRAHAQEGQENAEHTGDGNHQHEEQRGHIAEQQNGIQDAEIQPQKQFPHLHRPADEDERQQHPHGENEQVGDFFKYLSLKKRRHRATSCKDAKLAFARGGRLLSFFGEKAGKLSRVQRRQIEAHTRFIKQGGKRRIRAAAAFFLHIFQSAADQFAVFDERHVTPP